MSVGLVLGARYELHTQLGEGGFGAVWRAFDLRMRREVAVKLLHVAGADVPRFEREAQALGQLNHPAIVTAHDFGVDNGTAFLVLELIAGRSLGDELAAALAAGYAGLPLGQVLHLADQVLDGLTAAHSAGFVHRDLKPQNIMIVGSGPRVKIVDFGVAHALDLSRMTSTGMIIGSLPYCSPEQLDGAPLDGRSDLYSLGCTLHELLTGESPYRANTPVSWMQAHHMQAPARVRDRVPDVPPAVDDWLRHLLAKDPSARPVDARAARALLARAATGRAPAAVADHGPRPAAPAPRPPEDRGPAPYHRTPPAHRSAEERRTTADHRSDDFDEPAAGEATDEAAAGAPGMRGWWTEHRGALATLVAMSVAIPLAVAYALTPALATTVAPLVPFAPLALASLVLSQVNPARAGLAMSGAIMFAVGAYTSHATKLTYPLLICFFGLVQLTTAWLIGRNVVIRMLWAAVIAFSAYYLESLLTGSILRTAVVGALVVGTSLASAWWSSRPLG